MQVIAYFALFFGGLLWSFRDAAAPFSRVIEVSLLGAVIYLGLLATLMAVVRSAAATESLVYRSGWWMLFILLATANIALWALMYRLL